MVEVSLKEPDDFLKVRETLTRIGVASRKERKRINLAIFYIARSLLYCTFQRTVRSDGKKANLSLNDVQRRNRIVQLLSDWGLVSIEAKKLLLIWHHLVRSRFLPTKKRVSGHLRVSIISARRKNK